MNDYAIITDATADLTPELCAEKGITVIPMRFAFSETETFAQYSDHREYAVGDFFRRLREGGEANTSQINVGDYLRHFLPHLEAKKDILYIAFSAALSGSYNSARLAVEQLREQYGDRQICCFDSKSASLGEYMIVLEAQRNKEAGLDLAENQRRLADYSRRLAIWLALDDLYHLKRGGRCSSMDAFMGTLLNVKPLAHFDEEGKLQPMEKVRSAKKALERLAELVAEHGIDAASQTVGIAHADNPAAAEQLRELLRERCGVQNFIINQIGPVIGCHTGAGAVAVVFVADRR